MSMLWPDITTWPDITEWPGDVTPTPSAPTPLLRPEATVTLTVDGEPVEVDVTDGQITLDETWSPYVQAELTVPWTSVDVAETIDPQEDQRVTVEATEAVGGSTRTFDLGLRGRRIDHKGKRITLTLHSDEALLFDKRLLAATADTTSRAYESSFRDVCGWALDKIGATLEAGDEDADLTAYWPVTNLVENPSFETGTDGVATGVGASGQASVTMTTPTAVLGSKALRMTAAAGTCNFYVAGWDNGANAFKAIRVTAGKTYTASVYLVGSTARNAYVALQFRAENGLTIVKTINGDASAETPVTFKRYHVTGEAPVGAMFACVVVFTEGNSAGQFHFADAVMLYEGDELVPPFDGDTATDDHYEYAWGGDAHESQSTRTPDIERPPALFHWLPGQSLWDFLQPLMEKTGFRLFCDEDRVWRLVDLSTYDVSGQIVVQEKVNAIEGEDEITRNDDTWGTGVVCHYEWTDIDGIRREAYDYAGTDDKVVTVPYPDTPFPGPGAAAALLQMFSGRGRTQDTSRLVDYTATPGMSAVITLPGTLPQSGKVSAVTFHLKEGLMDIGSRGLTEITPGSWADVDADLEWDDTGTTDVDWKDWI